MIALLACAASLGIFCAGYLFASYGVAGTLLVGFCALALGLLFAVAQTHGFEGESVKAESTMTWNHLWHEVQRWAVSRNKLPADEPLYVETPTGPMAVTGVYFARINHRMSVVLDLTPIMEDANGSVSVSTT